jgi:uncharacterized protein (TIGR00304 family)
LIDLVLLGTFVMALGIAVIVLAMFLSSRSEGSGEERRGRVRGGGVVMIGPIPIIFGTDAKWAAIAIALAIVLVIVSLLVGRVG